MKTWFHLILLILSMALVGCGAFGTKTLYKTDSGMTKPTKVGYSQIARSDIVEKIVKGSTSIYDSTMARELANLNMISKKVTIEGFKGFNEINKSQIKALCDEHKLDGLILTQLIFINVQYSTFFIPLGVSEDTEVEMQYYDADGTLLYHTKHNTHKGNSYWDFPLANRTVADGTKGALKRIVKEIER